MANFWENDPIVQGTPNPAPPAAAQPLYALGAPAGLVSPGNLDLNARTVYHAKSRDQANEDFRTENSISIGTDQGEVLIPTVVNGRQLTPEQAIAYYQQSGENLGTFKTPADADTYSQNLHVRQAEHYRAPAAGGGQFWANDAIVDLTDTPAEPTAQQRYDAALEKIRQLEYPGMAPEEFRKSFVDPQATLIPGLNSDGYFAPYGATELAQHGLMFGLTDEARAGMDALGAGVGQIFNGGKGPGMGDVWNARLELEQARRDLGREKLGGWGPLAEVAGGLASGGKAAQAAATVGAQVPGMLQTAKGLLGAAVSGGAYGFGSTDGGIEQRLPAAGIGAGTGVAVGAAAPWVARGVQKVLSPFTNASANAATKAAVSSAPTAAAIKASSKARFNAAEKTGAVVDGNALNLLNHDVRSFLTNEGMLLPNGQLVRGYSKVSGALDALQQFTASGSLSVKQAQVLRKTFARAAKSQDGSEAAIGSAMVKQLDDFFENLPVQAFSTNGKAGMDAVKHWAQAREDWARFKKTDQIEKAIKNASYSRDGFAEGLRAQFASILKSEKKSLSFSAEELAAMDKYANGGSIEDFLKNVGKGGAIPVGILGSLAAGPVAGTAAAVGRAGVGKLARSAVNSRARNAASAVRAQVALPGGLPRLSPSGPPVIDGSFRRLAVNAANPALEDKRTALLDLLQGYPGGAR